MKDKVTIYLLKCGACGTLRLAEVMPTDKMIACEGCEANVPRRLFDVYAIIAERIEAKDP